MFDSSEFISIFLNEANEIVEALENDLVILEDNKSDSELLNKIFRAAHTLKSSAGTVGFDAMSDLNHVAENLLEKVRSGTLEITADMITVLLEFLDVIKEMLHNISEGANETEGVNGIDVLKQKIKSISEGKDAVQSKVEDEAPKATNSKGEATVHDMSSNIQIYLITLAFKASIFENGIDPLMFLSDLRKLGTIQNIKINYDNIPSISHLEDPYHCYTSFEIDYESRHEIDDINNIFLFVVDDNDIVIKEIASVPAAREMENTDTIQSEENAAGSENTNVDMPLSDKKTASEDKSDKESDKEQAVVAQSHTKPQAATTIRVDTRKLDSMMNLVGELVIAQSRIMQITSKIENGGTELKEAVSSIDRITREIQEEVMNIRMMPIGPIFSQFKRYVRDLCIELDKDIKLEIKGETTEIDKNMLEQLSDPLKHIIRNSIDHGIEATREMRIERNKPEYGTIILSAAHQEGHVVISIEDNGNGLNKDKIYSKALEKGILKKDIQYTDSEIYKTIFLPGFSTADKVSDISGRGVGMDVVRVNIEKLKGRIEIKTDLGKGTTIIIKLPLTLAIIEGITFSLGSHIYVMPLLGIIEQLKVKLDKLKPFEGKGEMINIRGEYIPLVRLHKVFDVETTVTDVEKGIVVVAESGYKRCAIFVDELLDQQQVVIKSLDDHFSKHAGISGGTILGDGQIALIIDIQGLANETLSGCINGTNDI